MSGAHIIAFVRRRKPDARLRSDGVWFWIESASEVIGLKRSTTDRAWRSAMQHIEADR